MCIDKIKCRGLIKSTTRRYNPKRYRSPHIHQLEFSTMAVWFIFVFLIHLVIVIAQDLCQDKPDNHLFANPEDCKSFFICRDQVAVPETCSVSFWFDPTRLVCALPEQGMCSELACLGYSSGFAGDPYECGLYHYCSADAVLYSGVCQNGLTFYPSSQACTYPYCGEASVEDVAKGEVFTEAYYVEGGYFKN